MRATLIPATALLLLTSGGAGAQSNLDGRVGKLESEMRAVQRKVFPDGAGRYIQPDIEAAPLAGPVDGAPATSALADVTSRVSALESQLTSLTAQTEQAGFRARQVQEQFDAYKRATDTRLLALEAGTTAPGAAMTDGAPAARSTPRPATEIARPTPAATPAASRPVAETDSVSVTRPDSGDAAEDAYLYGYRLWAAKRYPQAQTALKKAAADHPRARRYSYAQNLLGRAYLDDGKPSLASMAFYDNYKKMPDGERAPESLYYLAQALVKLDKTGDACKVYDELSDVYAAKIGAKMKADIAAGRTAAKCK